jgi:hypothetical protein
MSAAVPLALSDTSDLMHYPFTREDRLDSHYFMVWMRRQWLNSDMRLMGTPECRAYYFDLINIAYDQSPIGTIPRSMPVLAKLLMVSESHLQALCSMPYGPLHKWEPCHCGDEIRLMHPVVLESLTEAISRKEDNRARNEAGNRAKARQRLRTVLAGYSTDLAKNDAAVLWVDEWLTDQGCSKRTSQWIEQAMAAWSNHMMKMTSRPRH